MNIAGDSSRIEIELISVSDMEESIRWIDTYIDINLPGFRAHFKTEIDADSILEFAKSIEESLTQEKNIVLTTLEDSISLQGEFDEYGKIIWSGEVKYPFDGNNKLIFSFEADTFQNIRLLNDLKAELQYLKILTD